MCTYSAPGSLPPVSSAAAEENGSAVDFFFVAIIFVAIFFLVCVFRRVVFSFVFWVRGLRVGLRGCRVSLRGGRRVWNGATRRRSRGRETEGSGGEARARRPGRAGLAGSGGQAAAATARRSLARPLSFASWSSLGRNARARALRRHGRRARVRPPRRACKGHGAERGGRPSRVSALFLLRVCDGWAHREERETSDALPPFAPAARVRGQERRGTDRRPHGAAPRGARGGRVRHAERMHAKKEHAAALSSRLNPFFFLLYARRPSVRRPPGVPQVAAHQNRRRRR